jgi:hypothetical protein
MGTWSEPLFTNYPELIFNFSKLDDKTKNYFLYNCMMYQCEDNIKLENFINCFIDTSAVYGYFSPNTLINWKKLFLEIKNQNNNIMDNLEFHFYCSDHGIAFIIEYDFEKNEIILQECDEDNNSICFEEMPNEYYPIFNKQNYKKYWMNKQIKYTRTILFNDNLD